MTPLPIIDRLEGSLSPSPIIDLLEGCFSLHRSKVALARSMFKNMSWQAGFQLLARLVAKPCS